MSSHNPTLPFSIAFVTGHIGPDNTHIPKKPHRYPAYFITNNPELIKKAYIKKWIPYLKKDIPLIDPSESTENFLKNSSNSKPLKVFPNTYLDKPYDYVIWIDDKYNSRIRSNINVNNVIKYISYIDSKKSPPAITMHRHPFLNSIDEEYDCAIHYQDRYWVEKDRYSSYINEQISNGYLSNQSRHYETGFIIYNFKHPKTAHIQETWMTHINSCGIQCQISFNFVHQQFPDDVSDYPYRVTKHKLFNLVDVITGN